MSNPFFDKESVSIPQEPVQERINEYWSRWAADYESYQQERKKKPGEIGAWERVWRAGLPEAPAQVLDVGTGSGHVAITLAHLGYRVTGIDLAEGMLAQARARTGYTASPQFGRGDAARPPFEPESFDAVTARYLLWTLRRPEEALDRWLRILRPGGRLVVVDSLWFPGGIGEPGATNAGEGTERSRHFAEVYMQAREELPVAEAGEVSAYARLIQEAGFVSVQVDELSELHELDQQYGVAAGHHVQMQYRITARRPE